jgi:hypothetical protein
MLADGEFLRRFYAVEDSTEEKELLRTGLEAATRAIAGESEERERKLKEALTAIENLETKLLDAQEETETIRGEREAANKQRAQVATQLDEREAEVQGTAARYATEVQGLRGELRSALRWAAYLASALPVIGLGVGFVAWQWELLTPLQRGVSAGWTLIVLVLFLGIPLGKKGLAVFAVIAALAGLIVGSVQLWNG